MPRAKRARPRDLADPRIFDLIPINATAEQVLEAQHRLLEAYKRGQEATIVAHRADLILDRRQNLDPPSGLVDLSAESPAGRAEIIQVKQARVDDWMRDMLLPMAQALAPGADESRLTRLMLADMTIGPWLKDRSQGKDSPGEAALEGALVQMLKRASIATSQPKEDEDGE